MAKPPSLTSLLLVTLVIGCFLLIPLLTAGQPASAPGPAAAFSGPPREARSLLANAIAAMDSCDAISARINLSAQLLGSSLVGSGLYLQQDPQRSRLMRMELNIQGGDKPTTLVQICDGRYFWSYLQTSKDPSLTRVDLARLDEAQQAAAAHGPPLPWTVLGGLPKLLRSLDQSFVFPVVEAGRLQDVPVWKLDGRWNPERLALLLPEHRAALTRGQTPESLALPPHLPDEVVLYLGQEDLFPYRLEYRRHPASADENPLILALQLSEVTFHAALDPNQFSYNPGNMSPADDTAAALQRLGLPAGPPAP